LVIWRVFVWLFGVFLFGYLALNHLRLSPVFSQNFGIVILKNGIILGLCSPKYVLTLFCLRPAAEIRPLALSTEENSASPPEGRIYTAARPQGAISFCVSKRDFFTTSPHAYHTLRLRALQVHQLLK